jgi:hypothetical protein
MMLVYLATKKQGNLFITLKEASLEINEKTQCLMYNNVPLSECTTEQ